MCFAIFPLSMCKCCACQESVMPGHRKCRLVLRLPRDMHLCRSSPNVPRLPSFLDMLQAPHVLLMYDTVHNPLRLRRETTSEGPKVVQGLRNVPRATTACTFSSSQRTFLTRKCALRHNGVQFSIISRCVFDLEMCSAQRWRALDIISLLLCPF